MGDVRMVLRSCTHIMRQKAARASARCYWCFFFLCVCSLLFSLSAFCLQLFRVYFSFVHVFALNWRVTVTRVFVRKREVERKKFTNNNNNNTHTHTHRERGTKKPARLAGARERGALMTAVTFVFVLNSMYLGNNNNNNDGGVARQLRNSSAVNC